MSETPDWLHVGAEVACHTVGNHMGNAVKIATVTKIGKRDVVLDDGTRFNVNHLSRHTSTWGPRTHLRPIDDPAVQRDMAHDLRRNTAYTVTKCMEAWVKSDNDDDAKRAMRALRNALTTTPRQAEPTDQPEETR